MAYRNEMRCFIPSRYNQVALQFPDRFFLVLPESFRRVAGQNENPL